VLEDLRERCSACTPYTVIIFAYRKPNTTPAHFKTMYETKHIPLVQSIAGSLFPASHTRRYLARAEGSPQVKQKHIFCRCAAWQSSRFRVRRDCRTCLPGPRGPFKQAKVSAPANTQKLVEDEDLFLDRSRMTAVALGDTVVTIAQK
jgi:EthD domain